MSYKRDLGQLKTVNTHTHTHMSSYNICTCSTVKQDLKDMKNKHLSIYTIRVFMKQIIKVCV